jgi:hypothetical protein
MSEQFYIKDYVSLQLSSMTSNIPEHVYPTKYKVLLIFSRPSARSLEVFPNLQLSATDIKRSL